MSDPDCIFCKIVQRQAPASIVYQDDRVTAFQDLDPQLPTHILLVPNQHVANTDALEPAHDAAVGAAVRVAATVARQQGLAERGYRLVINTGQDARNTVPHLHLHLLGGRKMGWPPG